MPQSLTAVSIFLASPSDVSAERVIVTEIVSEWNSRYSRHSGVAFQLLKWETSITAGFGTDGQGVINSQINDEYDVLIALFWTKLGSNTPRAPSGTVEEYRRAWSRFKEGEDVELAFFFKEELIDPRVVDLKQLSLVKDFEKEVQQAGALTRTFREADGLKFEVSTLLDRLARKYGNQKGVIPNQPIITSRANVGVSGGITGDVEDKDIGLFDIIENLNRHAELGGVFLNRLAHSLTDMSSVADEVTQEFEEIKAVRSLEPLEMKPGLMQIADSLDRFSDFAESDLPDYAENLNALATDVRDMIRVSYDWIDTDEDMLSALWPFRDMLSKLRSGMVGSQVGLSGMVATVNGLPRAMTRFNKSKRRLVHNVDSLMKINENGRLLIDQAINELGMLIVAVEGRSSETK